MDRLASTKAASASRLNLDSRDSSLVGESKVKAVEGSKGVKSDSGSAESGDGRVGRSDGSVGSTVANNGNRVKVYGDVSM